VRSPASTALLWSALIDMAVMGSISVAFSPAKMDSSFRLCRSQVDKVIVAERGVFQIVFGGHLWSETAGF